MRIAICDDREDERRMITEALQTIIKDFSADEFEDENELLKGHGVRPYDLIILDIIMPKISGIDTAAVLRKTDVETPVVFASSSEEFGVQSYRVLAFDYLLKPIDKEQLETCIKRLFECKREKQYISITYSGIETRVLLSNIQCLESNLRKVIFTLSENREIEIMGKLTNFESFLAAHGFCRCHKSYLVNIEHIDSIEGDTFCLTGGKKIKISRSYLQSAKKAYFDYVLGSEVNIMEALKNIIPLFILLFICTLNGYSMMNYRLPAKKAYGCFAAVTAFCLVLNSYIVIRYGNNVLRNVCNNIHYRTAVFYSYSDYYQG